MGHIILANDSTIVTVNHTVASPTELRLNDIYVIIYVNLARLLVQGLIPFVLLTILNYRIYWVIKRRREMINRPATAPPPSTSVTSLNVTNQNSGRVSSAQKKANEQKQAIVLFIIVLLFFICHTPRFVLNVHEFLTLESLRQGIKENCNSVSLWALIWASVSHLLMTLNSSVNFFIYCFMCKTFRMQLWMLAKKFLHKILCKKGEFVDHLIINESPTQIKMDDRTNDLRERCNEHSAIIITPNLSDNS